MTAAVTNIQTAFVYHPANLDCCIQLMSHGVTKGPYRFQVLEEAHGDGAGLFVLPHHIIVFDNVHPEPSGGDVQQLYLRIIFGLAICNQATEGLAISAGVRQVFI